MLLSFARSSEDLVINVGTISGGAQISYSFEVVAIKLGMQELVVGLESDKVELVSAEAEVRGGGRMWL